jgi:tetratricopeptide (TPR) repeat protein
LNRATGETVAPPGDNAELMDMSAALAQRLAQVRVSAERSGAGVLIALDGLDKLSSEQNLRWLPIVPGVHWLAPSLPGEALAAALARGFAPLDVKPLSEEERRDFIAGTLKRWRRELEPQHIARILKPESAELAGSPLYLKTVLEELRVSTDNARLSERLEDYRGARDMANLFDRVLKRLEDDCEPGLVAKALPLTWASRAGLEEAEILAITGASPLAWATLRNGLGDGLRDQQGRLVFGHDYLSQAVEARYLATDQAKRSSHLALATHFERQPAGRRKLEEWPWQVLQSGDVNRFADIVTDVDNVALMQASDWRALDYYWRQLEQRGISAENLFGVQWNAYHADMEAELAKQNTAYLNPKHFIVPDLCAFLADTARHGKVAGEIAEYFFDALRFADDLQEVRHHLRAAFDLCLRTGRERLVLAASRTLEDRFGAEWRGDDDVGGVLWSIDARLQSARGNYGGAIASAERAIEMKRRAFGDHSREAFVEASNLAGYYSNVGRHADGEALHRRAYDQRLARLGPKDPDTLVSASNLAANLSYQGRYKEALTIAQETLKLKLEVFGAVHPSTHATRLVVAQCCLRLGDAQRSQEALQDIIRPLGNDGQTHDPNYLRAALLEAWAVREIEGDAAWASWLKDVASVVSRGLMPPMDLLNDFCAELDEALLGRSSAEEARPIYQQLYAAFLRWEETDSYSFGVLSGRLAATAYDAKRYAEAADGYSKSSAVLSNCLERWPNQKASRDVTLQMLDFSAKCAESYLALGDASSAFDASVKAFMLSQHYDVTPSNARLETVIGRAAIALLDSGKESEVAGDHDRANQVFERVADGIGRSLGRRHQNYIAVLSSWAGSLLRQGSLNKALEIATDALAAARQATPVDRDTIAGLSENVRVIQERIEGQV